MRPECAGSSARRVAELNLLDLLDEFRRGLERVLLWWSSLAFPMMTVTMMLATYILAGMLNDVSAILIVNGDHPAVRFLWVAADPSSTLDIHDQCGPQSDHQFTTIGRSGS